MEHSLHDEPRGRDDVRGPASFRRQLEVVKEGVRIEEVAGGYGEFKLAGSGRLLGRCVSPGHEDKTPSMHIFTEDQRFKCFGIGCGVHGDVLDLVQLAEGRELWEAMMVLSTRYGIELPGRPEAWFRKQERQKPIRDAYEEMWVSHYQRRLYRKCLPAIGKIRDDDERQDEIRLLWDACREIAVLALAGRMAA